MTDSIQLVVHFPPGSLKKKSTIEVKRNSLVSDAVKQISEAAETSKPEEYIIYCEKGCSSFWLQENSTFESYGGTSEVCFFNTTDCTLSLEKMYFHITNIFLHYLSGL